MQATLQTTHISIIHTQVGAGDRIKMLDRSSVEPNNHVQVFGASRNLVDVMSKWIGGAIYVLVSPVLEIWGL